MSFGSQFGFNVYGILRNYNQEKIKNAKEKLKKNELTLEDVLKDQELVNNLKINYSPLQDILTKQNLMLLIKNAITFPEDDSLNTGYKFPFYSMEILASDNLKTLEKFFEDNKKEVSYKFSNDEEVEDIKIDKFYANSEDKKLNIKNMEVIVKEKKKEKEIKVVKEFKDEIMKKINDVNEMFKIVDEKADELENKNSINEIDKVEPVEKEIINNVVEEIPDLNQQEDNQEDKKVEVTESTQIESVLANKKTSEEEVTQEDELENDALKSKENVLANNEENGNDFNFEISNANEKKNSDDSNKVDKKEEEANPSEREKTEIDIYLENSKLPLLDFFFSFLSTDEELDHVLAGYFFKIFNSLFISKTIQLVSYLFERPEIVLSMVNHFNRISIVECLIKLIKYDTDSIILFDKKSCDEVKEEVFKEIFDYIDNKIFNLEDIPEVESLHCITEFFMECLEDKRTFLFFIKCPKFSLKLFETFLHPSLSKQIFVITRYLEKVYIELTYKPLKQPEVKPKGLTFKGEAISNYNLDKEEDNSQECYYFLELFTSMIDYLFQRFKDENYGYLSTNEKEIDNSFGEKQKKLGLSKLYIMNLVFQILKHTFFVHENKYFNYEEDFFIEFYEKITKSEFFSVAVKYFFEFPWNNMYQNIFNDIVNEVIVFSQFDKTIADHVLYDIGFLEEIILCVVDEKYSCISKFQFKSNEIQNGFLTFIIQIAYNVKFNSINNTFLQKVIEKSNFFIKQINLTFFTNTL